MGRLAPQAPYHRSLLVRNAASIAEAAAVSTLSSLKPRCPGTDGGQPSQALSLRSITPELLDSAIRLMRLLEKPRDIPILAPLVEREILYRLSLGDQTPRQIA